MHIPPSSPPQVSRASQYKNKEATNRTHTPSHNLIPTYLPGCPHPPIMYILTPTYIHTPPLPPMIS